MKELAAAYRILADETRLRALRLLVDEELNATELTRILGLAQSAVSKQLSALRDAGLVQTRKAGRFAYFSAADEATSAPVVAEAIARVRETDDVHGDLARLEDVRRERRERTAGVDGDARRPFVPGRSWVAWARALSWLVADGLHVADIGCGEGALTLEIARFAEQVTGVDVDPKPLRRARALARRAGVRSARFRRGDMQALPFEDGEFDLAVLSQSLHFADDPERALSEARRITTGGGRVLVVDLAPHSEAWVSTRLGHKQLGFAADDLRKLMKRAGLRRVRTDQLPARPDDPFRSILAIGSKPA